MGSMTDPRALGCGTVVVVLLVALLAALTLIVPWITDRLESLPMPL